jgi:hypothetical protein
VGDHKIADMIFREIISDLFDKKIIGNVYRPDFIERLILKGLGDGFSLKSADWSGWDIEHSDGVRIEVKQSAALQTWSNRGPTAGRNTAGSFDIAPRTGYYDDGGSVWKEEAGRAAQIYVFAWHPLTDQTCDHRDPAQWRFFIVPSAQLPGTQKTISRRVVESRWPSVAFDELRPAMQRTLSLLIKK